MPADAQGGLRQYKLLRTGSGSWEGVKVVKKAAKSGACCLCERRDGTTVSVAQEELYGCDEGYELAVRAEVHPRLQFSEHFRESVRVLVKVQGRASMEPGKLLWFNPANDTHFIEFDDGDVGDYAASDPDVLFLVPKTLDTQQAPQHTCTSHPTAHDKESSKTTAAKPANPTALATEDLRTSEDAALIVEASTRVMVKLVDGGKEILFPGIQYIQYIYCDTLKYIIMLPQVLLTQV